MFAWMLSSAVPEPTREILGQLPPPVRALYRAVWKPRFEKTRRW
jgi:hypothetical protein